MSRWNDCPDRWEAERRGRDDAHYQWWLREPERSRFDCDEADRHYSDAWTRERDRMDEERREEERREECAAERRAEERRAEECAANEAMYEQAAYEAQIQADHEAQISESESAAPATTKEG